MRLTILVVVLSSCLVLALAQTNNIPVDASTDAPSSSKTTTTSAATTTATSSTTGNLPTTTQAPTPSNQLPTWTVKSANSTCLLLTGNFTFAVTYTTAAGNSVSDKVDIPKTAKASGSCGPFLNSLVLTWDQGNLTFMFIKRPVYNMGNDTGNGTYGLTSVFGRLTVEDPTAAATGSSTPAPGPGSTSPGQTFYISVREPGFMTTPLENSYSCESYQSLAADKTGSVYLEMTGVQVEAFHDGPSSDFSPSQPCAKDTLSSVLPIIGYVVLALLVGSGLGYFAWKNCSRAGYTEV